MTDPAYQSAEVEARKAGLGLWQQAGAVAPWDWRKLQKEKRRGTMLISGAG
jgi:endonuclease YncB( thermonuclease family)